jgi:[ribosomal protein S5]-alanine N-acetyltransferase
MTLLPINLSVDNAELTSVNPDCVEVLNIYKDYYQKIGFSPPWIGYFVIMDGRVVGSCSFTGQPQNGRVEIAYWTFKPYEGKGVASFSCKQLVLISKSTDPNILITAKTSPEHNVSTRILEKNGFKYSGIVKDEDIGEAWEWIFMGS